MCVTFAQAGYGIVHLRERTGLFDVLCNGVPAELKKTRSASNLDHYVSHALNNQQAQIVLIEFEKETREIHNKLHKYKKAGKHIIYYFTGREDRIYSTI